MSVTETRDLYFDIARADIADGGTWYREWTPESDWDSVMYMDCSEVPRRVKGSNCTSWWNSIRCRAGSDPIGGTARFNDNDVWTFWEPFNLAKNYPPFTVLIARYGGPALEDQGHKAVVSSWEDHESREQTLLSSDAADGYGADGYLYPGANEDRYMSTSHYYQSYDWAGVVIDQPILDGFPGYAREQARDRALWSARCMEELGSQFGVTIPGFYFAMMSLTELRDALDPNTTYPDIRNAPGYMSPVDHRSMGPGQMQETYWPMPWSFTVTVACFARALADLAYQEGVSELPTDKQGAAEAIQSVWKSFDPTGSNYAANYAEALELTEYEGTVKPEPEPEPDGSRYVIGQIHPLAAKYGYYRFESEDSYNLVRETAPAVPKGVR